MKKKHILLLISILLWVGVLLLGILPFPQISLAEDTASRINLLDHMNIAVDPKGEITFDELNMVDFENYNTSGISGALSDAVYYIEIALPEHNSTSKETSNEKWLLEIAKPQLDSIRYRQIDSNGKVLTEGELGRKYPFHQRSFQYRNFIIPLKNYIGSSKIYLAIQTQSYLQVPTTLWEETYFTQTVAQEQMQNGIFYGMLIIMIIYNGLLGISLKDKNYYYFMGCILSYTLLQCVWDGYAYEYLWPTASQWDMMANPFFINTSVIFLLAFTNRFLHNSNKFLKLNRGYHIVTIFTILATLGIWVLPIHYSVYISMGIAILGILLCSFSMYMNRLRNRPEKIYLMAWQMIFAGNGINILAGMHLFPYTIVTMYAPKVGCLALVSLFSLALSDRINQTEYQKGLETQKRILLKELHDMNRKITELRDLSLVFESLLTDFLNITSFDKDFAVLVNEKEGYLEIYQKDCKNNRRVLLQQEQFDLVMASISEDTIVNLNSYLIQLLICETGVKGAKAISLVNRGKRIGFIVLYNFTRKEMEPIVQEMVLDYASQIAITLDNMILLDEVTKLSQIDGLTQVYNRTHFFKEAEVLFDESEESYPLAALMLDIDLFKIVNDTYGHQQGDAVLQQVVHLIKVALGAYGIIGRYGGEEFIVAIPNQNREMVIEIAENIRKTIESTSIKIKKSKQSSIKITISIGIALKKFSTKSLFSLTEEADKELYLAKTRGRNQISVK